MKLSVIIEYIKSCRLWMSAVFLLLYILSHVCDISASFWLSDWSNDAIEDPKAAINKKYFRLTVYAVLGFSKCTKSKLIKQNLIRVINLTNNQ